MTYVDITFYTIDIATEFAKVLSEKDREEEFTRKSSLSFYVAFPTEADYEDCKAEVEELMWHLGFEEGTDYYFNN